MSDIMWKKRRNYSQPLGSRETKKVERLEGGKKKDLLLLCSKAPFNKNRGKVTVNLEICLQRNRGKLATSTKRQKINKILQFKIINQEVEL